MKLEFVYLRSKIVKSDMFGFDYRLAGFLSETMLGLLLLVADTFVVLQGQKVYIQG